MDASRNESGHGGAPARWYEAEAIARSIGTLTPKLREIRHDLHKHPELGFEEHRTQGVVRDWLERHGFSPRPCAGTGLVADLHPERIGKVRTIGLRADLDCLPMHESTDLAYRSVHEGRAHKCGHDGHTAVMMGVAALLAERRDAIPGNVRLIFQPAEEGVRGGGAKVMVAEGALEDVDEVYGLHNWPNFPLGEVRVCPGAIMAATHTLHIEVRGKGGHASAPETCRDPIVAAAALVGALQTVVARGLGHRGGAVVSIASFQAGTTHNVIPDRARLKGTVRTVSPETTERVLERIREVALGIGPTYGVEVDCEIAPGYPVLVNAPECAEAVQRVAKQVVGDERVTDAELPIAGAEDFAYMTRAKPGAYFFIGSGDPAGDTPTCHHPDFDFDDRIIPTAVGMFMGLVRDRLG